MENPPVRERDWGVHLRPVLAYLEIWPFMCYAGLVLALVWMASYFHLNVALVCTLGFLFLFQVEKRQRARLLWSISHEERQKASKMRMAEGETVRWVNEVTEKLWPMFLEDFASQILVVPMNSFMDRFCKPWSVRKVVLQNLSLGKTPPIVTMVRILDETAGGDDLALEASLEWNAAKDMAANVAVQIRRRVGFGIWTNLHLCKLQLEGKVKVGMKFKPDRGWPVIERIRFCFAKAPHIDMEARPIYNSGVDVSEVPGIASYMDHLVAEALGQSLVEPNHMEIDVVKLMKDEKLMKLMMPSGSAQSSRGAWFSFGGNPPTAHVIVKVMEATNLRIGDFNGFSDPYVKVTLNGTQHRETKVIWKTLNPKWNETFGFSISSWDQPNTMLLKVRDKDHIFDDQLGHQIVELTQYRDGNDHDVWLPLEGVDTGKIHLLITIVERPTDSQSSEDVSNTNSTTTEEFDRPVPSEGLPISPSSGSSPIDRVSTRQRLKNLKSRNAHPNDPLLEDSSGKRVGRQRSGLFSSSSRKAEIPHGIGSDRKITAFPSGEYSTSATRPMGAEVAEPSTDGTTTVLDVGFGEPGAIKFCQLGDVEPTCMPSQWVDESQLTANVSGEGLIEPLDKTLLDTDCLNVEEDGHTSRKGVRNARQALHCKFHRTRKGFEKKDSETETSRQDLQSRRRLRTTTNGVTAHVTVGPLEGEPARNSCGDLPPGFDSTATTGSSVDHGGGAVDAGVSVGDRDAEKQRLGTKAKGLFVKAAEQLGQHITKTMYRRKKKDREGAVSSDEVDSSGELTVGGSGSGEAATMELGSGTEASATVPGTQQQLPPTSKPPVAVASASASVPPTRPPPGLPRAVASLNVQPGDETTQSSPPFATHSGDAQENFPMQGQELPQTQGPLPTYSSETHEAYPLPGQEPQRAPPPVMKKVEGASIPSL